MAAATASLPDAPLMEARIPEEKHALVKATFAKFDKDGSGQIANWELREAMKALGEDLTDDACRALIKEIDSDKDGEISFAEFCSVRMRLLARKVASTRGDLRPTRKAPRGLGCEQLRSPHWIAAQGEKRGTPREQVECLVGLRRRDVSGAARASECRPSRLLKSNSCAQLPRGLAPPPPSVPEPEPTHTLRPPLVHARTAPC